MVNYSKWDNLDSDDEGVVTSAPAKVSALQQGDPRFLSKSSPSPKPIVPEPIKVAPTPVPNKKDTGASRVTKKGLPPPRYPPPNATTPVANIGPREDLESLARLFPDYQAYQRKVKWLGEKNFTGWRRIRGDGNCFYRSVGFTLLEQLNNSEATPEGAEPSKTERQRMARATSIHGRFATAKFVDSKEMAAHNELLKHIEALKEAGGSWPATDLLDGTGAPGESFLHQRMRVQGRIGAAEGDCPTGGYDLDLALIRALKRISANYLLKHSACPDHGGFISFDIQCKSLGYETTEGFVNKVVLPMQTYNEFMGLTGVARALGEDIRVMYLDKEHVERRAVPNIDYSGDPNKPVPEPEYKSKGKKAKKKAILKAEPPRSSYWGCCRQRRVSRSNLMSSQGSCTDETVRQPAIQVQLRPGHCDMIYFG